MDFVNAFDLYKRFMDPSSAGALEFANRVVNPKPGAEVNLNRLRDEIGSEVLSRASGWSDDIVNANLYAGQIMRLAELLATGGWGTERAVEAATEKVFEQVISYEREPLIGLERQNLPEDYEETLRTFADDYKRLDARGKRFDGEVSFSHRGGGIITMIDRENGTMLLDENGKPIAFNIQHLRDVSARREVERRQKAIGEATAAQQRRQEARRLREERRQQDGLLGSPSAVEQEELGRERVLKPVNDFLGALGIGDR